ncbi:hypothetical protein LAUMK42_02876 [Mycobacterium persicum]|uniref:HTH tetR-type domain-containing protein n=1 Tax=Mycobacterium persicum TaxID=1487726 RepID=A0AB38UTU4_9MYCO|nr:hypothetical protein LAUMK42_02876 [Mycobacterium persicum]
MSLKFGRSTVMSYARRSMREALRRVALKTFARKGFANVTVTELAREAGVTERTRSSDGREAISGRLWRQPTTWSRSYGASLITPGGEGRAGDGCTGPASPLPPLPPPPLPPPLLPPPAPG